ncbi:hypothetical protein VNI00_006512 [Paramarasmius palmivorus]|uniref:AB hydrolase-1 domain-containing protein n=1 Tax=Paramarasmius palmivorus TaxID=297713 RepID=A0AAW0D4X2_9AGAR
MTEVNPGWWPESTPTTDVRTRCLQLDDLEYHILEAVPKTTTSYSFQGQEQPPLIILLHGFPELCYSWRRVLLPLCEAGYHVVAPDQRGYGRTASKTSRRGEQIRFEDDLSPFRMLNLVKDIVALVYGLGHDSAEAIIGHDFGSLVAGYCALIRPDLFLSVVMMSAPFPGPPSLPAATSSEVPSLGSMVASLREQLGNLTPPRKHYTLYFSSPEANEQMLNPPGSLHSFLRHYFHAKSADWKGNVPYRLPSLSAVHLAAMPRYYIMLQNETMPEAVTSCLENRDESTRDGNDDATPAWLPDDELAVYTQEYARTGFQGGLNWYRCMTDPTWSQDLKVFSGKRITVPAMFISGRQDWGTYQSPGAAELMREQNCERMDDEDFVLIEGAGHWVQQEQSSEVVKHIIRFLEKTRRRK